MRRALDLCVSTLADGEQLHLFLTDGRTLMRHALAPLPDSAVWRGAVPGAALWQALLPGAVGDYLARTVQRPLRLRLPIVLDGLPWEQAMHGGVPLCDLFHVSRQLRHSDADEADEADEIDGDGGPPEADALQWLQCSRAGRVAMPLVPGVVWHHWRSGGEATEAPPATWTACQVVRLATPWTVQAVAGARQLRTARLWILDAGSVAADGAWLLAVCRQGAGVLVLPARDPGTPDPATALCSLLAAGQTVAEAVRELRDRAQGPWLRARLYGCVDRPLVQARAAAPDDERRQVTSLSVDVVDSTSLMVQIGEELYARRLSRLHERIRQQVAAHGGMASDHQGNDGVMCYFGHPVATEDAATRAVTAALALSALGSRAGMPLRVGLATGQVVVHQGLPFGARVHLAARLQQAAEVGGVLVCELTRALAEHAFAFGARRSLRDLKGFSHGGKAYAVLGAQTRTAEAHRPRLAPLLGRQAELAQLEDLWTQVQPGRPRVAMVRGEPGIGKSRLLRELRQRLRGQGHEPLEMRCRPDGGLSPFHGVADALTRLLGLDAADAENIDPARIEQALPPALRSPQAAALVAGVVSAPAGVASEQTPERLRERTLQLLVAWFRHVAQASPLCLVVEDLHWIDPSTGEFLQRLLADAADLGLLLVLTQRSDTVSAWQPPHADLQVELVGLSDAAARQLVAHACRPQVLPAGMVRQLAQRADGVPLFLEESARMAAEQHALAAALAGPALDVPARLQDLLMLRLDRLGNAKRLAQWGAVLGRSFPRALLERVLAEAGEHHAQETLHTLMAQLTRSGMVIEVARADGPELLFKHALVRDVAYQSLWQTERRRMHEITAVVLRRHSGALAQNRPELLALHLTEAGASADALGLWERAARLAAARSAHLETIGHLQQAMALLPQLSDVAERNRTELRLSLLLASRLIATEGYGAAPVAKAYARAAELAATQDEPAARLKIVLGLEGYHFMRADFDTARGYADRAIAMAEAMDDPVVRVQSGWALANVLFHQGVLVSALGRMDHCLAQYRPDMHRAASVQNPAVMCLCYSAWGLWNHGLADTALARIAQVLQLAEASAHRFSIGEAHAFAASVRHFRGETEAALRHAEQCIAVCEEGGFAVWLAHARIMRGRLWCEQGRVQDGVQEMQAGYAQWVRSGAEVTRPFYLAMQAEGLALAGDLPQALAVVRDALARVERTGERYHEADLHRLHGELLLREDPAATQAAEASLQQALAFARTQQTLGFELRAACALARLWLGHGRAAEAQALLAEVLSRCTEGQDTRDLRVAQALLDTMTKGEGVMA